MKGRANIMFWLSPHWLELYIRQMMAANGVCVEEEFVKWYMRTVLVSWENELEAARR